MTISESILAFPDRQYTPITAWGVTVHLAPMSGTDRDSYDLELHRAKEAGGDLQNWRARFLVRCLFDDGGARLFRDDQAPELGLKNADTLRRLFELASAVNATGPGAVESAAKNS